ncbi:MAG: pseudouridine synthase [Jaaginema sp. PMC 1079.18]|nr:pseudouridine synthase [Jaaginema sp. PMC 1080.18]MEC4851316.1 pseudouridine synthase [Jaaginema sp. PMC 1079.18]MEC4868136.1 pseudouridine synthase [Jaaginema sp. PMC 1078.18]
MKERVQKIIAQWGIASRRQAEALISEGRVRLNGEVVQLGQKADPKRDRLEVDGKHLKTCDRPEPIYLLLHKPQGVVTTCADPQGRQTVLDLLPKQWQQGQGIHPVGRLDTDSTGALLLTNDGALTQAIAHPRSHIKKLYHVWVVGHPTPATINRWQTGIILDGQKTLPTTIKVLTQRTDRTLLAISLCEGRNRQIRRIAEQLGHPVLKLHRTAIGPVQLQGADQPRLPVGQYRPLSPRELQSIRKASAMTALKHNRPNY